MQATLRGSLSSLKLVQYGSIVMPYPWVLRRSLKFGTLIVMPCAWVLSEKPKYATPYFDMQATLRVSFSSLKLG